MQLFHFVLHYRQNLSLIHIIMTTLQFITAVAIITLIAGVAYFRYKKEKNGNPDILRFPSGKPVPPDEELLKLGTPELDCMQRRDTYWLLDYSRKKILSGSTEEETLPWHALYERIEKICINQI